MKECPRCFCVFDSNVITCLECNTKLEEETEDNARLKDNLTIIGMYKLAHDLLVEARLINDKIPEVKSEKELNAMILAAQDKINNAIKIIEVAQSKISR